MSKKYEDLQLMFENTVKENDNIKKELDAHKIDVLAFKTNNDTLLKDKLDLEADLKAFREDLGNGFFYRFIQYYLLHPSDAFF